MQTLVTLATLGAMLIGAEAEAAVVVFLFLVGEVLEAYSVAQARRSLYALSELLPRRAYRLKEGGVEEVPLKALRVGDLVRVPPGSGYRPTGWWCLDRLPWRRPPSPGSPCLGPRG